MGDRGQVLIKDTGVYLYTHGSGYRLLHAVQEALRLKERWNDDEYLARIIFDKMTRLDGGVTGFGISTSKHDDLDNPLVVVDVLNQKVIQQGGLATTTWDFNEFIKSSLECEEPL